MEVASRLHSLIKPHQVVNTRKQWQSDQWPGFRPLPPLVPLVSSPAAPYARVVPAFKFVKFPTKHVPVTRPLAIDIECPCTHKEHLQFITQIVPISL